jgi:hypothetical protein
MKTKIIGGSFLLLPIITALILCIAACSNPSGGGGGGGGGGDSSAKAITGFTIDGVAGSINAAAKTVTVTLPQGTALTALSPVISSNGASVSPASGEAQNFAFLVPYTVTATDGSAVQWIVTVKWEPLAPETNIGTYLGSASGGDTADDPIILPLRLSLAAPGWANLLAAIKEEDKYVALDLSECDISSMTGTPGEFDPQPGPGDAGESKIVSLILPDEAASIAAGTSSGNAPFKHFSALKSVTGGAVTGVGNYAFYGCKALKTVSLPAATRIGYSVFAGCTALKTVNLPAVQTIDRFAFQYCAALETVSLPAATTINRLAFHNCSALTTINLPASLTSISESTFRGCTNLTNIIIAANNSNYKGEGGKLLTNAGATLIAWPAAAGLVELSGITTIGEYAFDSCTGLTSVSIPTATRIGNSAFDGCTALKTASLPAATTIGGFAFQGCTSLETADLPAVQTIDGFAFTGTGTKPLALTLGAAPPTLGRSIFLSVGTKAVTVKVPNNAAWDAIIGAYNGTNTTNNTWGNAFRGGGWDGTNYLTTGTVNSSISLTIEVQEETL